MRASPARYAADREGARMTAMPLDFEDHAADCSGDQVGRDASLGELPFNVGLIHPATPSWESDCLPAKVERGVTRGEAQHPRVVADQFVPERGRDPLQLGDGDASHCSAGLRRNEAIVLDSDHFARVHVANINWLPTDARARKTRQSRPNTVAGIDVIEHREDDVLAVGHSPRRAVAITHDAEPGDIGGVYAIFAHFNHAVDVKPVCVGHHRRLSPAAGAAYYMQSRDGGKEPFETVRPLRQTQNSIYRAGVYIEIGGYPRSRLLRQGADL